MYIDSPLFSWLTVACAALVCLPGVEAAQAGAQRKGKRHDHFVASVKMVSKSGRTTVVKVGDIRRGADGKVVATGVAAPRLDALTNKFVARWKRYKKPNKVVISEEIYSDSGMRPARNTHRFTFTDGDPLHKAAVVRKFVKDNGYETLGLSVIKFVEYDTEKSKAPRGSFIHDESLKNYNYRKGTKVDYHRGSYRIHIYARVRPANNGNPMHVLRRSASRPSLALAQNHDAGTQEVGYLDLHSDGRITIHPRYARDVFESDFGSFNTYDRDVGVSVIENGKWKTYGVALKSPMLFEAYVVEIMEHSRFYRVHPVVDPVQFE